MALSDIVAVYTPQAALEARFPGFKACFGGEELQKANAAMTSKLVGGMIEALLASDMPPSLAQLTSKERPAVRPFSLSITTPSPGGPGEGTNRPSTTQSKERSSDSHSASNLAAIGTLATTKPPRFSGSQVAMPPGDLDALAEMYHNRLELLGLLPPRSSRTDVEDTLETGRLAAARSSSVSVAEQIPADSSNSRDRSRAPQREGTTDDATLVVAETQDENANTTASDMSTAQHHRHPTLSHHNDDVPATGHSLSVAPASALHQALGLEPMPSAVSGDAATLATSVPGFCNASFDSAYSLGLVLQDLALRCVMGSEDHQTRLIEACQMYSMAVSCRPSAYNAMYNWGVALSDLARITKSDSPLFAKACLDAACQRYAQALAVNPDTPQALNNWGLVLQELSGIARGRKERDLLLRQACSKFRQAIRLRPEFDRGVYNLGTVCYAAACVMQGELTGPVPSTPPAPTTPSATESGRGSAVDSQPPSHTTTRVVDTGAARRVASEAEMRHLFTSAAQYILLAFALQQHKEIYRKSLGVLRKLLPLPFLRAGYLTAIIPSTLGHQDEAWRQDWFVLDGVSLRSATGAEGQLSVASASSPQSASSGLGQLLAPQALVITLQSVSSVSRLRDPSVPKGEAFVIVQHDSQLTLSEVVLVAEDEDTADGWVDVLMLAAYCVQSRSTEALSEALMPAGATATGATTAHHHNHHHHSPVHTAAAQPQNSDTHP